ncbi:NADH-ubiquinone oxidoreductase B18 subunit family protein [Thecamonas trahens ATCC 50062]|uniref:NADH dehydrogenase [ubiquinone] 1 beta subcomplex subunit 7 n=1 Tax=Thecamonas trahens ATCC 50062 TaxID=461836 RepID=A0A0L0DRY5_THETB|nr:NADH-ubiquinone oxidoreductase B18 subunit family protein [Thecamonas trahens ATCC 50062]KNC54801.1 NADH-ubiquinone oxidoreductase B18 subunit family protein [Thecamonas trahens ATCC 50062]|eukprot:XP_013761701.1 NADH-ubiquinone oxidoreductase B18 subunit family protein [Thecamonas trahens ATCC 50062]
MSAPEATQQEMKEARLDLAFRDGCAHLLIPLNQCRRSTLYMPFKCTDERHTYEKCQYDEYIKRVKLMMRKKQEDGNSPLAPWQRA